MIECIDRIIVSGLAGVVGTEVARSLADAVVEDVEIVGVFRAASSYAAFVDAVGERPSARIEPLVCDLADPAACRAAAESLAPAERVIAVHAAADVGWHRPLDRMWGPNVLATRNFAELVRATGRTVRLVYVSSAYTRPFDWEYRNAYEETKAAGERLLREDFADLRPVVFSCSLVAGDTVTGRIARFHGLYPLMAVLERFRVPFLVGGRDKRVDVVPVDWVATELAELMARVDAGFDDEEPVEDVVASAGNAALVYPALVESLVGSLNRYRIERDERPLEPVAVLSFRQWRFLRRTIDAWDVKEIDRRSLGVFEHLLKHYGPYLEDDRVLGPVNVTLPAPDIASYLDPVVGYWLAYGPRAKASVLG